MLSFAALTSVPAHAQQLGTFPVSESAPRITLNVPALFPQSHSPVGVRPSSPLFLQGIAIPRQSPVATFSEKTIALTSPGMIERWESAFYCNDTPFIDQVRFPLATLWGGRIKLIGFESDVTTANFVLGLPGGGTLPSLGMFSSGHLAMHTPPSDQIAGINMTFHLRGSENSDIDNSGLHGVQYVLRAGRGFLQSFGVSGR